MPVAITALVRSAVGLLLGGGVYFTDLFVANRAVLETEPGDTAVVKH